MQSDFHYYATYALARAAGLKREVAAIIATAAQYVDDAIEPKLPMEPEGFSLLPEVTAHTTLDIHNTRALRATKWDDQRLVWAPFHFLPAGKGSSLSERLVCDMDSDIAREMVARAVDRVTEPFGLELLGIAAHVYADTFSHRGFSGVSSRRNRVLPGSIAIQNPTPEAANFLGAKLSAFKQAGDEGGLLPNFRTLFGKTMNLGALGHGSVETCPDQPFLIWSFEYVGYEDRPAPRGSDRNNPLDFEVAAQRLYEMFAGARRLAETTLADPAGQRPFENISGVVQRILWSVGDKSARADLWKAEAQAGRLYNGQNPIPDYDPAVMDRSRDALCVANREQDVREERAYRFYQAAGIHRWYVLRELLPKYGIVLA